MANTRFNYTTLDDTIQTAVKNTAGLDDKFGGMYSLQGLFTRYKTLEKEPSKILGADATQDSIEKAKKESADAIKKLAEAYMGAYGFDKDKDPEVWKTFVESVDITNEKNFNEAAYKMLIDTFEKGVMIDAYNTIPTDVYAEIGKKSADSRQKQFGWVRK